MNITLQYFDGCPNWETTRHDVAGLLDELELPATITLQRIESPEEAEACGFRGSPTLLVDGVDPFADPDAPVGLACRIYITEAGPAGSPSPAQLRKALTAPASPS